MAGIIEVKDQGKVRIYDADNSNYIDIVVPSTVSSNRTITIPDANLNIPTSLMPFRNIIINGDMSIAQRATSTSSITSSGYHSLDRFRTSYDTAGTWTQSQSTDVPTGQGFAKSFKMDCTTANGSLSAGSFLAIQSKFEGQNLQYLKKGTSSAESLTLSFWVKSNKTGTYIANLYDADNNRYIAKSYTISSANTWEKKTLTYAGDTSGAFGNDNATSLELKFILAAGTTYTSGTLATSWESATNANTAVGQVNLADSTSNEWYVTGVQLEAGTTASDFEFLPHDVNYGRCVRYCRRLGSGVNGRAASSSVFYFGNTLEPPMRATPTLTLTDTSVGIGNLYTADYTSSGSAFGLARSTKSGVVGSIDGFSGMSAGEQLQSWHNFTDDNWLLITAEL